jgi:uncharacterized protein (DUF2147 family)
MPRRGFEESIVNLVLAMLLMFQTTPASSGALGNWVTADKSVVDMYQCGQHICGKLVQFTAPVTTDNRNPHPEMRQRPLCGLIIVEGFRMADATHATEGHVYDPESSKTYSGVITVAGDALKLRGYVGIPLFGRTEIWHRAKGRVAECEK